MASPVGTFSCQVCCRRTGNSDITPRRPGRCKIDSEPLVVFGPFLMKAVCQCDTFLITPTPTAWRPSFSIFFPQQRRKQRGMSRTARISTWSRAQLNGPESSSTSCCAYSSICAFQTQATRYQIVGVITMVIPISSPQLHPQVGYGFPFLILEFYLMIPFLLVVP